MYWAGGHINQSNRYIDGNLSLNNKKLKITHYKNELFFFARQRNEKQDLCNKFI